jgi:hypothetical protein
VIVYADNSFSIKPDAFFTFDERQQKMAKVERMRILPAKSIHKPKK